VTHPAMEEFLRAGLGVVEGDPEVHTAYLRV
jgi:hypothetical protein